MDEPDVPAESRSAGARWIDDLRARTSARVLRGRAGLSYRTSTQLELRVDHAAARDAVQADVNLARDFRRDWLDRWDPLETTTRAATKAEYLMRPELGRSFSDASRAAIVGFGSPTCDIQIVIGDGLSASAVITQAPALVPLLERGSASRGWSFGRLLFVHHCRVGILNEVGELLDPRVVVLLIGERPGLATANSLSAYLGYRPRPGDTDARRNLISNIHDQGVDAHSAAQRILRLADQMCALRESGVGVKEVLAAVPSGDGERVEGSLPHPIERGNTDRRATRE